MKENCIHSSLKDKTKLTEKVRIQRRFLSQKHTHTLTQTHLLIHTLTHTHTHTHIYLPL